MFNRFLYSFILFNLFTFACYAADSSPIEPEKIIPYDSSKTTTLAVAVRSIESQIHFFGGRVYAGTGGGFGKETVTPTGRTLSDREIKFGEDKDIPQIYRNTAGQLIYIFGENGDKKPSLTTTNKQEALDRQNRRVESVLETDPQKTLYLDISAGEDFIHLKGDILKITRLPDGLKVPKLIIEYLGDDLFGKKDFNSLEWTWLKNLHGLLTEGGKVFFEMRADAMTRQEKAQILDPLNDELSQVKSKIESHLQDSFGAINSDRIKSDLVKPLKRGTLHSFFGVKRALTSEEITLIFNHINPTDSLPEPYLKIEEILKEKFNDSGFKVLSSEFMPKHSRMLPTRFYDSALIEATPNT